MRQRFVLICIILGSAWITASCSAPSVSTPQPRPSALPTTASNVVVAAVAATQAPIPTIATKYGVLAGTVNLPAASGNGALLTVFSDNQPNAASVLSFAQKKASSLTFAHGGTLSASSDPIAYISFTAQGGSVVLAGLPGFTVTISQIGSASVHEAVWTGSAWDTIQSAVAASEGTLTFPPYTLAPYASVSLPDGSSLYLVLYTGALLATPTPAASSTLAPAASPTPAPAVSPTPSPAVSPTPTATPTPTPTPMPTLAASAQSLALVNQTPQTVTASEVGYTGVISESDNCSGIATVSPTSGNGPSFILTATPVAIGACSIMLTDANQESVSVPVTVTTVGLTLQSRSSR